MRALGRCVRSSRWYLMLCTGPPAYGLDTGPVSTFGPEATWADRNIIGVAFYRWIVFVMRGHNPGDNPYLGPSEKR